MSSTEPELFEVIALNGDGYERLPEPTVPYYVNAKEGWYLHKPTQIGNVLLKEYTAPKELGRIGYAGGVFTWKGAKVPASIISQAHDFFLRIFEKHHAEAEVLITKHNETNAFRLFVPYQRVNHGGVKSIYEPTHIDRNYTVVGTLHSHCDFTAFHSGTDSGDASDMDGVHFTIGHVNKDTPQIVAMVAMNGKEFHYPDVGDIADVDYRTTTSPPWWDGFVFSGDAPREKPASLVSLTQEHWDEFLGRALHKPKVQKAHVVSAPQTTPKWTQNKGSGFASENKYDWRREVYGAGPLTDFDKYQFQNGLMAGDDLSNLITDKRIEAALDTAERMGVFTDYDWDDTKPADVNKVNYWRAFFASRMRANAEILALLGVKVGVKDNKLIGVEK